MRLPAASAFSTYLSMVRMRLRDAPSSVQAPCAMSSFSRSTSSPAHAEGSARAQAVVRSEARGVFAPLYAPCERARGCSLEWIVFKCLFSCSLCCLMLYLPVLLPCGVV